MTPPFATDPIFEANPRQVSQLLGSAMQGALALPDFQRDFTWEPRRTAELLASIMRRYPAGSLLFWRMDGTDAKFQTRAIDGAPPLKANPNELVLDGQQRLTSLFHALVDGGNEIYLVHLDELLSSDALRVLTPSEVDWERAVGWVAGNSPDAETAGEQEWQIDHSVIPVRRVPEFDEWLDRYVRRWGLSGAEEEERKRILRQVRDRYLTPLTTYGFPVVVLPVETPLEAVCTVFETLNRTAKPLGPFELLTARFYPAEVYLRDLWEEATEAYPLLGEDDFDVDPYNVLQAVSLRARNSAQRSDVLNKLTAAEVKQHWPLVVEAMADVLDMLGSECGVLTKKLLPYTSVLLPLAAVWPEVSALKPADRGSALDRVQRYFWCTVFSSNYDQGANSQAGADYIKLKEWLFDESKTAPEAVTDFGLLKSVLRNATTRRKALYTGLLALSVRVGARDFHDGQKLTKQRLLDQRIDSHHLFPKAYLQAGSFPSSAELALNRALIDRETNKIIGKKPPSDYLATMESTQGRDKLERVLQSHLVPSGPAIRSDDYETFIDDRLELVIAQIETLTGGKVVDDEK